MGGGGKTETVVDGGLSDDQYQDLADNQVVSQVRLQMKQRKQINALIHLMVVLIM